MSYPVEIPRHIDDRRRLLLRRIGDLVPMVVCWCSTPLWISAWSSLLEGQVSVARESASQRAKEPWALFVVELLSNVSPCKTG